MTQKNVKLKENESISEGKLHITENVNVKSNVSNKGASSILMIESTKDKESRMVLRPRIEAIHAGRTKNGNIYPADKLKGDFPLKSGVFSFLYPYPKPMIKNHDHDSEPTGRIRNAQFITDSLTGKEAVMIIPEITDPDTIEKVLDGRYMTVSIGASTDSAMCNICGTDILSEGWCGHTRGEIYDGVECGWIVGNLWFNECSWVNVPADNEAMIIDAGEPAVMEAYAQVGENYYNLGSEDESMQIKESAAKILGLYVEEDETIQKGGTGQMSKKSNTVTIESLTKEKTDLEATIVEKDTEIAKNQADITEKETNITSLETQLQEKETVISKHEATIEERDTTIGTHETKIAELEEEIKSSDGEKEVLTEEVATLKAEMFKTLVERVIELKSALGKPLPEDMEEAIEEHLARSEESLEDTLSDLTKEFNSKGTLVRQFVTNPGAGTVEGEDNALTLDDDGNVVKKTKEDLTEEDVLKNLFRGLLK